MPWLHAPNLEHVGIAKMRSRARKCRRRLEAQGKGIHLERMNRRFDHSLVPIPLSKEREAQKFAKTCRQKPRGERPTFNGEAFFHTFSTGAANKSVRR